MIQEKAMKVKLKISCYSGRKKDKIVTNKTNKDHQASDDAGNYNKHLINKVDLQPINSIASEARIYVKEHTLPWGEDKERILPGKKLLDFSTAVRNFEAQFDTAVQEFVQKFPALVALRQNELGQMYDEKEYPSVDEIGNKFKWSLMLSPIEAADDFRVKLSEPEIARIKADISTREKINQKEAMNDLFNRLHEVVNNMAVQLSKEGYVTSKGIKRKSPIYPSLVGNITKLTDILPDLNIENDPDLNTLCDNVKDKLCSYTPDELRKDSEAKYETLKNANDILDDMIGYMGEEQQIAA